MKKTAVVLCLFCWLPALAGAEQVNIILRPDSYEIGNLVNADADAVYMEDADGLWRLEQNEIEGIFDARTGQQIFASQLWKYEPRHSVTLNVLSSIMVYPVLELDLFLDPATTLALRGALNFQFGGMLYGGGASYRHYPERTAPRGWYFGGRADFLNGPNWSIIMTQFEIGRKHYFKNGFVFGYFIDLGAAIPTGGIDGPGALAVILIYSCGGGMTIGFSF